MKFPRRFFRRIFRNILKVHHLDLEIRCISRFNRRRDRSAKEENYYPPKQFWCRCLGKLQECWPQINKLSKRAYEAHFTVVARKRKWQGKKEHPLPDKPIWTCFWADLDVGEDKSYRTLKAAYRAVRKIKLRPNVIVESGSGLHLYWLLRKPQAISRKRGEDLLRAIADRLKGDTGAARATRLMRVPNTYNWKAEKKLARARYYSRVEYRLKELQKLWKPDATEKKGKQEPNDQTSTKYAQFFSEHLESFALRKGGKEALALCPFHNDRGPSFSVNVKNGLWKCWGTDCGAKGNLREFCKKMGIPFPAFAIQRFPRERLVPEGEEWSTERTFETAHAYVTRQIHFTRSWQAVFVTLWAMGTYIHLKFSCYGHLWINSPTTHSGKTKLEDVMSTICYKATEPQLNPTAAVLFRFPSAIGGTLILDEIDKLSPETQSDVIAVLNHYKSSGGVLRNVPGRNKQYRMQEFKVYCPKIIAGINDLPEVVQDRCFRLRLDRKRKDQRVERFMPGARAEREPLRNQLEDWAGREGFNIWRAYCRYDHLGIPAEVDDRLRDILEPLFAIAVGLPGWVKDKLIEAARSLAADRRANESESDPVVRGVQILSEHYPIGRDRWSLRSERALELLDEIPGIESVPKAQALLRRLGFRSQSARIGDVVLHAYVISRRRLEKLLRIYGRQDAA
jgi:CHC2 zinc finger/Protein of unknown function (DUF3631)